MAKGQRIISIAFREPPRSMFPPGSGVGAQGPDHLTSTWPTRRRSAFRSRASARPGPAAGHAEPAVRDAGHALIGEVLEAHEWLILDAMRGDHTLFNTAEGIERLWQVSTQLLEPAPPPVRLCAPSSSGPKSIRQLIAPHAWRLPFERAWRATNQLGG